MVANAITMWNIPLDNPLHSQSQLVRNFFNLQEDEARVICAYLKRNTIEGLVMRLRHARAAEEKHALLDDWDIQLLGSDFGVKATVLTALSHKIDQISREQLLLPECIMDLTTKDDARTEIKLENYTAKLLSTDLLQAVCICIQMNLRNVRRISFKNCQIDAERAANVSLVSSETQQFFCHLDVSRNPLKDQGVNALLSAACRNENCQLRVFQFASCQLEVQGAIRISHLLQGKHRNALGSQI